MRESIIAGMQERIEDCSKEIVTLIEKPSKEEWRLIF
jgi:hypothetical protein